MGFPDIKSVYVNLMLIGLFGLTLLKYPANEHSSRVLPKYKMLFFVLLFIIIFSSIYNETHWFIVMKTISEYYFPYVFLFLIINRIKLSNQQEKKLIKLCYFLIAIQIPVVLLQYFVGGYSNPDSMSGTISPGMSGGTGINGVLGAFLFSLCMSKIMITKVTISFLVMGLMAFVPSIFGGSKFGVILMPLVVFVLIFSFGFIGDNKGAKKIARYGVLIFILTIFIYFILLVIIPGQRFAEFVNISLLTDPKAVLAYDSTIGSQRIWGYIFLVKYIFKDWINLLIGIGPGATEGSMEFGVEANKTYEALFPLGAPDSIRFMATIGIIGLLLVIIIHFYGIVWIKKYLKIETCPFMKMNGYAFISITIACLASFTYTLVWASQIGLTYWVLAGVFVKRYGVLMNDVSPGFKRISDS